MDNKEINTLSCESVVLQCPEVPESYDVKCFIEEHADEKLEIDGEKQVRPESSQLQTVGNNLQALALTKKTESKITYTTTEVRKWVSFSKWKKMKKEKSLQSLESRKGHHPRSQEVVIADTGPKRWASRKRKTNGEGLLHHPMKHPKIGNTPTNTSIENPRRPTIAQTNLSVKIEREDGAVMDSATATLIRHRLAVLIGKAVADGVSGHSLSFAASGLSKGVFLVTANNEESRTWLLGCDFGDQEGIPIRAFKFGRERVTIFLPGKVEELPYDPFTFLKGQNNYRKELRLHEWTPIYKETMPNGVRLVMAVPLDVFKDKVWLNYHCTQVLAKVIRKQTQITSTNMGAQVQCTCLCLEHKDDGKHSGTGGNTSGSSRLWTGRNASYTTRNENIRTSPQTRTCTTQTKESGMSTKNIRYTKDVAVQTTEWISGIGRIQETITSYDARREEDGLNLKSLFNHTRKNTNKVQNFISNMPKAQMLANLTSQTKNVKKTYEIEQTSNRWRDPSNYENRDVSKDYKNHSNANRDHSNDNRGHHNDYRDHTNDIRGHHNDYRDNSDDFRDNSNDYRDHSDDNRGHHNEYRDHSDDNRGHHKDYRGNSNDFRDHSNDYRDNSNDYRDHSNDYRDNSNNYRHLPSGHRDKFKSYRENSIDHMDQPNNYRHISSDHIDQSNNYRDISSDHRNHSNDYRNNSNDYRGLSNDHRDYRKQKSSNYRDGSNESRYHFHDNREHSNNVRGCSNDFRDDFND